MKRRYLYPLMFAVPTVVASLAVMTVVVGGLAGILWLFVFGDRTWPSYVDAVASVLMVVVFLAALGGLGFLAFTWGKTQEPRSALDRRHALAALASTAAVLLLLAWRHHGAGRVSEPVACSNFCVAKGFPASMDRGDGSCRCMSLQGHEALVVPMADALRFAAVPQPGASP